MKAPTKSNWGLGVHLTPLKYVKPRPTGKTFTFSLDEMKNDMPAIGGQNIFELELWKLAKY